MEPIDLDTALAVQRALRARAGLPDERFEVDAFVGMLFDEIAALRAAGHDDAAIAALVNAVRPLGLSADDVTRHAVPPAWARHGG